MLCDTPTRKGKQCRVPVDPSLHPTTCHIHMPEGKFQKNRNPNYKPKNIKMKLSEDEVEIIRYWRENGL